MWDWRVLLMLVALTTFFDTISGLQTTAQERTYRPYTVANVAKGDVLYIRAEPDPGSDIRGTIPPNGKSIIPLGSTAQLLGPLGSLSTT